jgi:hypothetical protein
MADYFRHLVVRSLQPQAVVQPRLAGRYEPLQPGGPSWAAGQEAGLETDSEVQVRAQPQTRPDPAAPRPQAVGSVLEETRLPLQSSPEEPSPGLRPAPLQQEAGLKSVSMPELVPLPRDRAAPPPPAPVPADEPRNENAPIAVPPAAARLEAPAPEPAAPASPGERSPQPESPPAPPRLELKPILAPAPLVGQPERPREAPVPPAVEPAPVVNITIGRIEVRAAPPKTDALARKARSAPPVMSLEEYLKRRNGGRG